MTVLFNRYRLLREIGRGGMGVVWLARDERLQRDVAIKHVATRGATAAQAEKTRQRALREAQSIARLRRHPHVIAIHGVEEDESGVWLVLEYVPSQSLQQRIDEAGPLGVAETARIGAQIADALDATHAAGIQHRDVKPSNVLLGHDGNAWLTDFGISHLTEYPSVTATGAIAGTFAFLAPEIAAGGEVSAKADIFSLGATLYTAVEGRPPFGTSNNPFQLLDRVRSGFADRPSRAGALEPLLRNVMVPDPARRPDAATVRGHLIAITGSNGISSRPAGADPAAARPPRTPWHRGWRWFTARRRRPLTAACTAVVVATTLTTALWPFSDDEPPRDETGYPTGRPPLPTTAKDFTLTDTVTDVDSCALADARWLRQFGSVSVMRGQYLANCTAAIRRHDTTSYLTFRLYTNPGTLTHKGKSHQVGSMTLLENVAYHSDATCEDAITLADETTAFVSTSAPASTKWLCEAVHTASRAAAVGLADGQIPSDHGAIMRYPLARQRACDAVHPSVLRRIPKLPAEPSLSNDGWGCSWGSVPDRGDSYVLVEFHLAVEQPLSTKYGETLATVGGKRLYYSAADANSCEGYLVHSTSPGGERRAQLVDIYVWEKDITRACNDMIDLAKSASEQLH